MSDLYMAFSVVFPLFVYMLTGFLIRKAGWLAYDDFKKINKVIFNILIPITLFFNTYNSEFSTAVNPKLFIYASLGVFAAFALAWAIIPRFVHDGPAEAVMIQGIFRSNFVLFGATIGISICGEGNIGPIAALTAVIVPIFNILAVIVLEAYRGGKVKVGTVVKGCIKNPLVLAGVFGILASVVHLKIPELIETPVVKMGSIATPLALICLGGMLSAQSMKKHKWYLLATDTIKMVLLPAIMLAGGVALGMRGIELVALLAVFASPTAVASVPMAQTMGGDGDLAGEIVATTSVIAILTMFVFIYVLKAMSFI